MATFVRRFYEVDGERIFINSFSFYYSDLTAHLRAIERWLVPMLEQHVFFCLILFVLLFNTERK